MDEEEEVEEEEDDDDRDIEEEVGAELPGELVTGFGAGLRAAEIPVPATLAGPVTETVGLCTWTGLV